MRIIFQSTRPSRASTRWQRLSTQRNPNFNPQGPRGPRLQPEGAVQLGHLDFNPQGPRGPRPFSRGRQPRWKNFNPQGPRGPRRECADRNAGYIRISIHKALAGLDSKTIQQSLHIPLTFYALCPPLLISTSSIHSPSLFSRLFRCFSGANLPGISC